ncbi:VanZ family protein [Clostridium sp.]|jgi:glycopeptide antibiotics resistance protein|uniref:VanZ family protein n=1 Tax=Clostridium sp. TaxID=1506 RepID=UPI002A5DF84C|nr:VanZ family protein [Clostridium sp.]
MILSQIKKLLHLKKEKILVGLYILFFMYLCLMTWEIFIGPYRSYSGVRRYNLYPFKTIIEFLLNASKYNFQVIFINLIANIITFIPLGFFMSLLFRRSYNLINMLLLYVFIITCIEIGQFILNVGVLDIDDVILNTIGCVLGFMVYKVVKSVIRKFVF